MNITQVKIRKLFEQEDSKLRALVSIVIDEDFAVHDIKVIEGAGRFFVAMPNRKEETGFRDIAHPIGADARTQLEQAILDAYQVAVEKKAADRQEAEKTPEDSRNPSVL